MLGALITSKTRLKLLIKFFVSAGNTGYLRGIAEEFDESTNAIRKELNQLTEAGFLERKQEQQQKKILYQANTAHPLFNPVQRLVHSFLGIDQAIDQVMERAGDVHEVMLIGAYAKGQESSQLDLVVLGEALDVAYLQNVAVKTEQLINKKIGLQFEKPDSGSYIVVYQKEAKKI